MFQGSTAENQAIYRIRENDPEIYVHQLRWFREFDYDVMHIQKLDVIDEDSEYSRLVWDALNKIGWNGWKKANMMLSLL